MEGSFKKMLQKRVYDLLSHKYGILIMLTAGFLLTMSAFHFGEAWLEWSQDKYAAVFHSYRDNIMGISFRDRMSVPLPIDVVYTWVNGTDPEMLQQLEEFSVAMAKRQNLTRKQDTDKGESKCTYTNCLPIGVVLKPALDHEITLAAIQSADSIFQNVTDMNPVGENPQGGANFTLLKVQNSNSVKSILQEKSHGWLFQGVNYTIKPAFYTSNIKLPHGLLLPEVVMMSGYPSQYTVEEIQQSVINKLNTTAKNTITVEIHSEKGLALLWMKNKDHYDILIEDKNFTIDGKVLRLSAARLVWDLRFVDHDDVVAASRFEDNEELRYSLRSVENFAPWVRHIFIVTNGQIPYWLNLDNPHITIITHDEIFLNDSHLPTFSSPAIEANIHRIPGLSDKFLYLNDDVMFGSPVWPDDFFTHTTGHKVYLTWPVPNCNEVCPSTWIKDGYCDKACNSSECDWDGGDCLGKHGEVQLGAGFYGNQGSDFTDLSNYCSTGCVNSWLADKYCDQACNCIYCGFDLGDCGTDKYDQIEGTQLSHEKTHYSLTPGEIMMYFNLTKILGKNGKVKSAKYDSSKVIRAVAVSQKFKVMTMIAYKNHNATIMTFYLTYELEEPNKLVQQLNFTLDVDTSGPRKANATKTESPKDVKKQTETVKQEDILDAAAFEGIGAKPRIPAAVTILFNKRSDIPSTEIDRDILDLFPNVEMSELLRQELNRLRNAVENDELTEFGMKVARRNVMQHHGEELVWLRPLFQHQRKAKMDERAGHNSTLQLSMFSQIHVTAKRKGEKENKIHKGEPVKKNTRKFRQDQVLQHLQQEQPQEQKPHHLQPQQQKHQQYKHLKQQQHQQQNKIFHGQPVLQKDPLKLKNESDRLQDNIGGEKIRGVKAMALSEDVNEDAGVDDGHHGPGRKLLSVLYWSNQLAELEEQQHRTRSKLKDAVGKEMNDDEFLRLITVDSAGDTTGTHPWEIEGQEKKRREDEGEHVNHYVVEGWQGRQLLDTFGDSLRHVNKIYNKEFGFSSRKVPGHMPHMIDKNIMTELQGRFPKEWDITSSHKIRSSTDMQYAFAYYYYIMGVMQNVTVDSVFTMMDTDKSGVISDREIRTLAAKMYDLPLYLEVLTGLENLLVNCSKTVEDLSLDTLTEQIREVYYEKNMPQITRYLFVNCAAMADLVKAKFKPTSKYETTIMNDADIAFKMMHTNVSHVVVQLDDIRKYPKKFICLNDNIDHTKEESKTVKAILQDFYESLLPMPSQFELARDYRNRFLHMDKLREWKSYRDRLRFWTHVALCLLVTLTVISFLGDKIENLRRKWTTRRGKRRKTSSMSGSYNSGSQSLDVSSSSLRTDQGFVETV